MEFATSFQKKNHVHLFNIKRLNWQIINEQTFQVIVLKISNQLNKKLNWDKEIIIIELRQIWRQPSIGNFKHKANMTAVKYLFIKQVIFQKLNSLHWGISSKTLHKNLKTHRKMVIDFLFQFIYFQSVENVVTQVFFSCSNNWHIIQLFLNHLLNFFFSHTELNLIKIIYTVYICLPLWNSTLVFAFQYLSRYLKKLQITSFIKLFTVFFSS